MKVFRNVTISNPLDHENETWALCYLEGEGDIGNVISFDNKKLKITRKKRDYEFELHEISSVVMGHKRLLLPIIAGGVISPLTLLAIYENTFSPIILLLLFFSGVFLLYHGITGSEAIVFKMKRGKEESILMQNVPEQVKRFLVFLNMHLTGSRGTEHEPEFFHIYTPDEKGNAPDFSSYKIEGYILLTADELFQKIAVLSSQDKILKISAKNLSSPVKLSGDNSGNAHFRVQSINSESIKDYSFSGKLH